MRLTLRSMSFEKRAAERLARFRREDTVPIQSKTSVKVGAAEISRTKDRVEVRYGDRSIELELDEARVLAAALLQLTR